MVDDLFDLVLVLLLNAGLPLDVVDDERCCVLQDLAVLVGQCQMGACGRSGVILRGLLLALQSKNYSIRALPTQRIYNFVSMLKLTWR